MRKGLLAGNAMWRWSRLPRGVSCPPWVPTGYPTAREHQVKQCAKWGSCAETGPLVEIQKWSLKKHFKCFLLDSISTF